MFHLYGKFASFVRQVLNKDTCCFSSYNFMALIFVSRQLTWLKEVDNQKIAFVFDDIKCFVCKCGHKVFWNGSWLRLQNGRRYLVVFRFFSWKLKMKKSYINDEEPKWTDTLVHVCTILAKTFGKQAFLMYVLWLTIQVLSIGGILVCIFCLIQICLLLSDEANKIKSLNIERP